GGCGPYFRAASGRRCESLGLFAVSGYAHRRRWEQTPGWGLWCLGKIYPWKSQKLTVCLRALLIADARPRTPARECKQIGEPRGQHAYCNILWERWSREEFPATWMRPPSRFGLERSGQLSPRSPADWSFGWLVGMSAEPVRGLLRMKGERAIRPVMSLDHGVVPEKQIPRSVMRINSSVRTSAE